MSRVGLVVAAVAALGTALAGCSAMPDWMTPDWMSSKSDAPQLVSLQFDSRPPGAEIRTVQGQTCLTPCSLSVTAESQPVSINKIGFVPQTVQITAGEPSEHSFWQSAPPPTIVPNPVEVVLQAVPPPRRFRRPRPHHVAARPRRAGPKTAARQGAGGPFPGPRPMQQPAASPFPPPPNTQPAASPFPPPPPTQ